MEEQDAKYYDWEEHGIEREIYFFFYFDYDTWLVIFLKSVGFIYLS